jgi:hypothetical protein
MWIQSKTKECKPVIRTITLSMILVSMVVLAQAETTTTVTKDGRFQWEETLIYDKEIGGEMLGQMISPDHQTIALVVGKKGRQAVWCEKYGLSDYYSAVMGLFFSPDSKRFAYVATDDDGMAVVVVDGQLVGKYTGVWNNEVLFTDNSEEFVFILEETNPNSSKDKGKRLGGPVVVDGVAGPQYSSLKSLDPDDPMQVLCLDGNRIVYFARQENEHFAVIDGIRGPSCDQTGFGPALSADFAHIAYAGQRDSLWYVVVDSTLHGPYPGVAYVRFPPGASEPAYVVDWPDSARIFLNHQLQPTKYKWVKAPVFTDSGELRAYWASDGEKSFVVAGDGSDVSGGRKYYSVSTPWISDYGNHYVYEMVFDSDFHRRALVVDGTPLATVDCDGAYNI